AEVERAHRDTAQAKPGPILEPGREVLVERAQLAQHGAIELEQSAVAGGGHGRKAWAALEGADLAEHIAAAHEAQLAPGLALAGRLDQAARLHDPPAIGHLALAHDHVALTGGDVATALHQHLHGPRVELAERLVHAQERRNAL